MYHKSNKKIVSKTKTGTYLGLLGCLKDFGPDPTVGSFSCEKPRTELLQNPTSSHFT